MWKWNKSLNANFLVDSRNLHISAFQIVQKYTKWWKIDQNPRWLSRRSSIICLMMFLTFWYHLAFAIFSIKYWWIVDWSTVLVPLVLLDPSVPSVPLVPLVSMVLVIPINSANRIIPLVQGPRFKAAWAMPKRAKTTSKVSRLVFILTKEMLKDNWRENL